VRKNSVLGIIKNHMSAAIVRPLDPLVILIVILSVGSVVERSYRARDFVGSIHDLVISKDVIKMVPTVECD